jgi:hypothetical protein
MADKNAESNVKWFNLRILGVFAGFFLVAWLVVQGIHWRFDGFQWPLDWNNLTPDKYGLAWTHYWLSKWFLIIFTSYIVSLLTLFIGNTIDWKNEATETDEEADEHKQERVNKLESWIGKCPVVIRTPLSWLPKTIRFLSRISPTYDLAIFTLGVGVLISAAVLFISEACALTIINLHADSWSGVVSGSPAAFTRGSIVREIALAISGHQDGVIDSGFIFRYLACLFGLLAVMMTICGSAGIIVVRAAGNQCVKWGPKEHKNAGDRYKIWRQISKHLQGAVKDTEELLRRHKESANDLAEKLKRVGEKLDALGRLLGIRSKLQSGTAQAADVIDHMAPASWHGLRDVVVSVEQSFSPEEDYPDTTDLPGSVVPTAASVLGGFRQRTAEIKQLIVAHIAAIEASERQQEPAGDDSDTDAVQVERSKAEQQEDAAGVSQNGLETVPADLVDNLRKLLTEIAAFCERFLIDANAQTANLESLKSYLQILQKENGAVLACVEGSDADGGRADLSVADTVRYAKEYVEILKREDTDKGTDGRDKKQERLLVNLLYGQEEIDGQQNSYKTVKDSHQGVLEFRRGRYTVTNEVTLVAGSYESGLLGEKGRGGVLLKKWLVWFLVFFAFAINNYFIAPSLSDLDGQFASVLPIITDTMFGLNLFFFAMFLTVPFGAVTFVPLVYKAAQSVLPSKSKDRVEYRRQFRRGIGSIIVSGAAGLLAVYLLSVVPVSLGLAYPLFLSKPPVDVPTVPIHAATVYCSVTQMPVRDGGQASWMFADNVRVETDTADCSLPKEANGFNYVVVVGAASQEDMGVRDQNALAFDRANALAGAIAKSETGSKARIFVLSLGIHNPDRDTAGGHGSLTKDQRQIMAFAGLEKATPSLDQVKKLLRDHWQEWSSSFSLADFKAANCRFTAHGGPSTFADAAGHDCGFLEAQFGGGMSSNAATIAK